MIEEENTKDNKYGSTRQVWIKLSRKFDPTTGASKTMLHKKFSKYVTIKPKEWITEIEILRGDLRKLDVQIDYSEMMTLILSNLPEE